MAASAASQPCPVPMATEAASRFSFLSRVSIYFSCASPWNVGLAGADNLLLALLHVISQEQKCSVVLGSSCRRNLNH